VSIMSEVLDESFKSMMIIGIFHDLFVEGFQLFLIWKLSVNDEESGFKES
jgi:hypothetical protein